MSHLKDAALILQNTPDLGQVQLECSFSPQALIIFISSDL